MSTPDLPDGHMKYPESKDATPVVTHITTNPLQQN